MPWLSDLREIDYATIFSIESIPKVHTQLEPYVVNGWGYVGNDWTKSKHMAAFYPHSGPQLDKLDRGTNHSAQTVTV